MLESLPGDLSELFRQHDEQHLAEWIEHTAQGDPERLPRRVLGMFTQGMGGLMDRPLYSGDQLDTAATARRDVLADEIYRQARARLGS